MSGQQVALSSSSSIRELRDAAERAHQAAALLERHVQGYWNAAAAQPAIASSPLPLQRLPLVSPSQASHAVPAIQHSQCPPPILETTKEPQISHPQARFSRTSLKMAPSRQMGDLTRPISFGAPPKPTFTHPKTSARESSHSRKRARSESSDTSTSEDESTSSQKRSELPGRRQRLLRARRPIRYIFDPLEQAQTDEESARDTEGGTLQKCTGFAAKSRPFTEHSGSTTPIYDQARPPTIHYVQPSSRACVNIAKELRWRELLSGDPTVRRAHTRSIRETLQHTQLLPWRQWTGASKDIINLAWSPCGRGFLAGSSTDQDRLNLQYNRGKNLLWGDLDTARLYELDNHFIWRHRPEILDDADPDLASNLALLNPRLFATISSIQYIHRGDMALTGSYDQTIKVWDTVDRCARPQLLQTINFENEVELLDAEMNSQRDLAALAVAQRRPMDSISIFIPSAETLADSTLDCGSPVYVDASVRFSPDRGNRLKLLPTALKWGRKHASHLLLGGFAESAHTDIDRPREGDLMLWDVHAERQYVRLLPSKQCIFEVEWHHQMPIFATACSPPFNLTDRRKTKSVVRTYEPLQQATRVMEFECPAADINELRFNPVDPNLISASATDGKVYVWDARRPDEVLISLEHGESVEELAVDRAREEVDTGVRFMAWSPSGATLYSGSSDGIIRQWNPFVAPQDASLPNVASFDSAIMSGSFSPDSTSLLVGLCKGSVHALSATEPRQDAALDSFHFVEADSTEDRDDSPAPSDQSAEYRENASQSTRDNPLQQQDDASLLEAAHDRTVPPTQSPALSAKIAVLDLSDQKNIKEELPLSGRPAASGPQGLTTPERLELLRRSSSRRAADREHLTWQRPPSPVIKGRQRPSAERIDREDKREALQRRRAVVRDEIRHAARTDAVILID